MKIIRSNSKMYIYILTGQYITKREAGIRMQQDSEKIGRGRKYLNELPIVCEAGLEIMKRSATWNFFRTYFAEPNEKYLVKEIHDDFKEVVQDVNIRTFKAILRAYKADSGANIQFTNRKAKQKAMRVE